MRAHLGLVAFIVLMAIGVVLEVVGQNLLGTALILLTVFGALGAARSRSRYALRASSDLDFSERNRGTR